MNKKTSDLLTRLIYICWGLTVGMLIYNIVDLIQEVKSPSHHERIYKPKKERRLIWLPRII